MAFLARAVAEGLAGGDVMRLERLAVRFSRPIFPGDAMTTEIWAGDPRAAGRLYICEASRPDGERVLTGGVAELR
jgi:acyl dehydratase